MVFLYFDVICGTDVARAQDAGEIAHICEDMNLCLNEAKMLALFVGLKSSNTQEVFEYLTTETNKERDCYDLILYHLAIHITEEGEGHGDIDLPSKVSIASMFKNRVDEGAHFKGLLHDYFLYDLDEWDKNNIYYKKNDG